MTTAASVDSNVSRGHNERRLNTLARGGVLQHILLTSLQNRCALIRLFRLLAGHDTNAAFTNHQDRNVNRV